MTYLCPQTGQEVPKCANCGGDHPANSPTCRFTPRRNVQVISQRQTISYADAAKVILGCTCCFELTFDCSKRGLGNSTQVLAADN
nr:unnamed protein product [Callosobruchus chinensis]